MGFVNNVPLSGNTGKSAATVKGRVAQPGESTRGITPMAWMVIISPLWVSPCSRGASSQALTHEGVTGFAW